MGCKFKVGDEIRAVRDWCMFNKGDTAIIEHIRDERFHGGHLRTELGFIWGEDCELVEEEIKLPSEEGLQKAKDILNERYEEFELPKVIEKEYDRIIAEESSTGALRYNSDKPQLSQIDPLFLIGLAELMTQSAKKYSKWNYAKGQNLTTVCDSMSRHLLSFLNGENDDKESGKSHLLHIACNALIAYSTTERHLEKHPELDDRISSFLGGLDE